MKEKESKTRDLVSLGYANGWLSGTPQVVKDCTHRVTGRTAGRCLHEFTCDKCGYKYLVDSSG